MVWLPSIWYFPMNIGLLSSSQLTNSYFSEGVALAHQPGNVWTLNNQRVLFWHGSTWSSRHGKNWEDESWGNHSLDLRYKKNTGKSGIWLRIWLPTIEVNLEATFPCLLHYQSVSLHMYPTWSLCLTHFFYGSKPHKNEAVDKSMSMTLGGRTSWPINRYHFGCQPQQEENAFGSSGLGMCPQGLMATGWYPPGPRDFLVSHLFEHPSTTPRCSMFGIFDPTSKVIFGANDSGKMSYMEHLGF